MLVSLPNKNNDIKSRWPVNSWHVSPLLLLVNLPTGDSFSSDYFWVTHLSCPASWVRSWAIYSSRSSEVSHLLTSGTVYFKIIFYFLLPNTNLPIILPRFTSLLCQFNIEIQVPLKSWCPVIPHLFNKNISAFWEIYILGWNNNITAQNLSQTGL